MPSLSRRTFISSVSSAVLLVWADVGIAAPRATRALLFELASTLRRAAVGVSRVTTYIARGSIQGRAAKRHRDRLSNFLSDLNSISVTQTDLIAGLATFYDTWGPSDWTGANRYRRLSLAQRRHRQASHWKESVAKTHSVLAAVSELLANLRRERTALVDGATHAALKRTLEGRSSLLMKLVNSSPPMTAPDFAALNLVIGSYRQLHRELERNLRITRRYIATVA